MDVVERASHGETISTANILLSWLPKTDSTYFS